MGAPNSPLFIVLVVLACAISVVNSACSADQYTNLPDAPVYPTATLSAGLTPTPSDAEPLTQNHWSETAVLSNYRPPKVALVAKPAQTDCPHLASGLKNWHDASTWGSSGVPSTKNQDITLPENVSVLVSSCSIDPSLVFGVITVPKTSKLIFGDAPISISAVGFNVMGSLFAGSPTCRLRNKVTFTLYGKRDAQALPALPWIKGMGVSGSIDLHGTQYYPTWTRLAMTAKPKDTIIFVQDLVNWQPGQTVVVTTTELKDSRDWHRNEERKIVSVKLTTLGSNVAAIELDLPLNYTHFGGKEYQAEVSLLSRNIVVQGDPINSAPTDTVNATCKDEKSGSTYPCEDSYLTGFGAHIFVNTNTSQGRFSGVEMFRVGQTNVLGRYPIHFHLLGNQTSYNYQTAYVRDSSVHESYFRCFAIHGTSGALLTQNTAYNAIGHCYFLEDGVEEDNIISYNQAAHVHPLGQYWNPSIGAHGDTWGAQILSTYVKTDKLILPSDMAAGCFYITNTYNDIYGNAASGGWAGFSVPSLKLPVKLFASVKNMSPANRPFRTPFRGNSAHSTGYWWNTAGGIYFGGELSQPGDDTTLQYTSGRSLARDTCTDKTAGTPMGPGGCWVGEQQLWLRFEDNKVFLSNRGMQNWGNRAEIIRFEIHDVGLSMNVFGQVWIDSMLMECRSSSHRITYLSGCPAAPAEGTSIPWGVCNVRDYMFFYNFNGFQWYDVGQLHILTNSTFRNCRTEWNRCIYGPRRGVCYGPSVFLSLTHSDQFVPELMQATSGVKYQNVSDLWKYGTAVNISRGPTVSGRLQSWYDADGSASQQTGRTMIGSARANDWWKYNDNCTYYIEAYKCSLAPNDSRASLYFMHNQTWEDMIGSDICPNGGVNMGICPLIGKLSHFGSKNETGGLDVAVNAKVTGPLIAASGGWFMRFNKGTPKNLTLTKAQVYNGDVLLLALAYPAGTTFNIYHKAVSWCAGSYLCRHNFTAVGSIAEVRAAYGDAYYWSAATRTLYLRVVQTPPTFGRVGTALDKPRWDAYFPYDRLFARGGLEIPVSSYQSYIVIEASCSTNPCAPQNDVPIPPALGSSSSTTTNVVATTSGDSGTPGPSSGTSGTTVTPVATTGSSAEPIGTTTNGGEIGSSGVANMPTVIFTILAALAVFVA